jgi:hypothetical protein
VDARDGLQFGEQGLVGDVIEAALDVRIQDELGLLDDGQIDRFDGIVAATPGPKAVAVRLEARFPLWLQSEGDKRSFGAPGPTGLGCPTAAIRLACPAWG